MLEPTRTLGPALLLARLAVVLDRRRRPLSHVTASPLDLPLRNGFALDDELIGDGVYSLPRAARRHILTVTVIVTLTLTQVYSELPAAGSVTFALSGGTTRHDVRQLLRSLRYRRHPIRTRS